MQVNVKELTGVLHLRLVFMNVLVLQSFLAVSCQVDPVFQVSKFLPSVIIISSLQVVQTLQVILPSQVIQVFRLYPFPAPSVNC